MKKLFFVSASVVLLATQATAQIRPGDCRPVFPVVDQVAELPPPPAILPPPPPIVQKRRFNAAWLVGGAVLIAGLIVITHDHDHHHHDHVSPA